MVKSLISTTTTTTTCLFCHNSVYLDLLYITPDISLTSLFYNILMIAKTDTFVGLTSPPGCILMTFVPSTGTKFPKPLKNSC